MSFASDNKSNKNALLEDKLKFDLQGYAMAFAIEHNLSDNINIQLQFAVLTFFSAYQKSQHGLKLFDAKSSNSVLRSFVQKIFALGGVLSDQQTEKFVLTVYQKIGHPIMDQLSMVGKKTDEWMESRRWSDDDQARFKEVVLPWMTAYLLAPQDDPANLKKQISIIAISQKWPNGDDIAEEYVNSVLQVTPSAKPKV